MGSDTSPYEDERPEHTCDVIKSDYAIGRFPVTNAEYECFVQARGYELEDYWTPQGWAWRHQDIASARPPDVWFWMRNQAREQLDSIRQWPEEGTGSPSQVKNLEAVAQQTDEELIAYWRRRELSMGRARNPWRDDRDLNGANQPVVGVCWHEALAYCKWLTVVLRAAGRIKENEIVSLPNEPEWEKASLPPSPASGGGTGVGVYPWGADSAQSPLHDRANTLNGRVLTTTPVGASGDNASGCRALDMSGNVWEWTRSRWGDNVEQPTFRYPYSDDLEERERSDTDDLRIVRGGSWDNVASDARCAFRYRYSPDVRDDDLGFRCVLRSL
jgi:formylglycine-generating enzyme required for sulfatase activity